MKILKGRLAVATSNDKDKFPQCGFCGEKKRLMHYTEDKKTICDECMEKDGSTEFVAEV